MERSETEGPPDADVLRRMQAGDADAVGILYDRYGGIAYGLARRMTGDAAAAEDIVQDAFLAAWRYAPRFDLTRGSVRTWLLSIVHHKAVDAVRRHVSRKESRMPEDAAELFADSGRTDTAAETTLDAEAVRVAVRAIPDDQRTVIEMAYFAGMTHTAIAEQTGIPVGTVKSRMRLGLEKMREHLRPRVTP